MSAELRHWPFTSSGRPLLLGLQGKEVLRVSHGHQDTQLTQVHLVPLILKSWWSFKIFPAVPLSKTLQLTSPGHPAEGSVIPVRCP